MEETEHPHSSNRLHTIGRFLCPGFDTWLRLRYPCTGWRTPPVSSPPGRRRMWAIRRVRLVNGTNQSGTIQC